MVQEITEKEFNEVIKNGIVVVDCYAPWCGPCRLLAPILDEIAETKSNIKFYKLNTDVAEEVCLKYNIMSIPNVLIFKDNKLVNNIIGLKDKEEIINLLDNI